MEKVSIELLTRQTQKMHERLELMYQSMEGTDTSADDLLPIVLQELGVTAEELQVAVEELVQQSNHWLENQNQITAESQRYHSLFDYAPEAYLITDAVGVIQAANRAASLLLDRQANFLVGKPLVSLVSIEERRLFRTKLFWVDQQKQMKFSVPLMRGGEHFDTDLTVDVLRDAKGSFLALRWLICDRAVQRQIIPVQPEVLFQNRSPHLYSKGDLIPLSPQALCLITRGVAKLTTFAETGEEILVGLARESMVIGSSLTTLQLYEAIALTDVQLVTIPLAEISQSSQLAQALLPLIQQRLRQTESFLAVYGQLRAEDRLNHLLLLLKRELGQPTPDGIRLRLRLTHQELANACCTTRATISRLLSKLQQQGHLYVDEQFHLIFKQSFD
ncbi:helix-turn-helix domain-containing protein [Phormidium tenue FACHB-886]|nr:helix-turn-helix domain-containing protein [Phormidium tenue FACHB-886]